MLRNTVIYQQRHSIAFFLGVMCILIFLSTFILTSEAEYDDKGPDFSFQESQVLYVDDDAADGGDGSEAHPFKTIGDGIAAAEDGDSVRVFNGTYNEYNLYIDITMDLIGNGSSDTIIDGLDRDKIIEVEANWVNITGFMIQNADRGTSDGEPGIKVEGENITICDNVIVDCYRGIDAYGKNNTIRNNICYDHNQDGIYIDYRSSHAYVANNTCWDATHGIRAYGDNNTIEHNTCHSNSKAGILLSSPERTIVQYNTCTHNEGTYGYGIYLTSASEYTIIRNNFISDNEGYGIYIFMGHQIRLLDNEFTDSDYGISLFDSHNNSIRGNECPDIKLNLCEHIELVNNDLSKGVFMDGPSLYHWNTHSIDTSNTINGKPLYYFSNATGVPIPSSVGQVILANCEKMDIEDMEFSGLKAGILVGYSSDITITRNQMTECDEGLSFHYSNDLTIDRNTCSDNTIGLSLEYCEGSVVTQNNCSENDDSGLYMHFSNFNDLSDNNCSSNGKYGIYLSSGSGNIISDTTIVKNRDEGVWFRFAHENTMRTSTVQSNWEYGIKFYKSENNTIEQCTLTQNPEGLYFQGDSANNTVRSCNIIEHSEFGASAMDNGGFQVDARENWWGAASGPYHSSNPDGEGDEVTDYVDFSDWLQYPFDPDPPEILMQWPSDGDQNIAVDTIFVMIFSKPMDTGSVTDTLDCSFTFDLEWDVWEDMEDSFLIIIPRDDLLYNTDYTISFSGNPTDVPGNELEGAEDIAFTTEPLEVTINGPANDQEVSGEIAITGNATPSAEKVEIKFEDDWLEVTDFENGYDHAGDRRSGNWSHVLNTEDLPNGPLSFSVRSYGEQQYSAIINRDIIITNNIPPEVTQLRLDDDSFPIEGIIEITIQIDDENGLDDIESVVLYLRDGAGQVIDTVFLEVSADITHDYELTGLEHGTYQFVLSVTDSGGEVAEETIDLEIINSKPEIVSFTLAATKIMEGEDVVVTIQFTDVDSIDDITSVILEIRDISGALKDTVTLQKSFIISYTYSQELSSGNYFLILRVTDAAGSAAEKNTALKIEEEESDSEGMNMFVIVSILIIVACMIGAGVFIAARKKDQPAPAEIRPRIRHLCPNCQGPTRYLKTKERWICDSCKKFVEPIVQRPGQKQRVSPGSPSGQRNGNELPHQTQTCPQCGEQTTYSEEYSDHYCWECEEYISELE